MESDLWLVLFRVIMGWVVWEETTRMMSPYTDGIHVHSKLAKKLIDSNVLVPQWGAESWLPGLPGEEGLYLMHGLLFLCAFFLLIGFCSRLSALLILLVRGWIFLGNDTFYLNHHYLELLAIAFLCIVKSPSFSVDAWMESGSLRKCVRPKPIPAYYRHVVCSLLFVVYFYSAYSKLSYDWLRGANALQWFRRASFLDRLEYYSPTVYVFTKDAQWLKYLYHSWWLKYAICVGGVVWDLSAPFACMASWKPLNWFAVAGVLGSVLFHSINHLHLSIGMFPLLSFLLTMVLFSMRPARMTLPKLGKKHTSAPRDRVRHKAKHHTYGMIIAFVVVMILFLSPVRDILYTGNVRQYHKTGERMAWTQKTFSSQVEMNSTVSLTPLIRDEATGEMAWGDTDYIEYKMDETPLVDLVFHVEDSDDGASSIFTPIGSPVASKKATARIQSRPDQLQRMARKVARLYETAVCPIIYNGTLGCYVGFFASGYIQANDRRFEKYYSPQVNLADPELSEWPIDWLSEVSPAEGWLRYEMPPVFILEYLLGSPSYNPCLPWNRVYPWALGDTKNREDAACAHWWYSMQGGERERLRASMDWKDRLRRLVARWTKPWVEGYNANEKCSDALHRFYGDFDKLACEATPSYGS